MKNDTALKRSLGVVLLSLYGIGVTVGAGIYVLVGKVAGVAGIYAPVSFLVAAVLAGLTALSYGELAARFPQSAGEAVYVDEAFKRPAFATFIGLMVAVTGLVSAAVVSLGFVGYLQVLVAAPDMLILFGLIVFLTGLAIWGITQSVTISAIVTLVEVGGLLVVVVGGFETAVTSPLLLDAITPPFTAVVWLGVMNGALLAFFAFIGFEDIVNVAEEVVEPEQTIRRAILITLAVSSLLYLGVALVSVLSVPLDQLSESKAPLALVFEVTTGLSPDMLISVAVIAVLNGALIQIIMASRIIYGLSQKGWLPAPLGRVWSRTQTPVIATILVAIIVLLLAAVFPIVELAETTSYITLTVFGIINVALLRLRQTHRISGPKLLPLWIPALGCLASFAMIIGTLVT